MSLEPECDLKYPRSRTNNAQNCLYRGGYLIGVKEAQNCDGQLGEEDQCEAEGELETGKTKNYLKSSLRSL